MDADAWIRRLSIVACYLTIGMTFAIFINEPVIYLVIFLAMLVGSILVYLEDHEAGIKSTKPVVPVPPPPSPYIGKHKKEKK